MKILYTGGNGQLATQLKELVTDSEHEFYFPEKNECNLLRRLVLEDYALEHKYFDVIITGANIFPGRIEGYNLSSFLIGINHIYLLEQLESYPKHFINLTTGLKHDDEHFLYRAQKTYQDDLFQRYFNFKKEGVNYINFMPHHLDDPEVRKMTATLFLDMLDNIESYDKINYVCDIDHNEIRNGKW